MTAFLLLVIFLVFAGLMLRGKIPALLALPAMAILMSLAARVNADGILSGVIVEGSTRLAAPIMAVFFGAYLGQVTLMTGIAERIVKLAAEFCGDKPIIIAFIMAMVTGVLFTSLTGLGAVIMIGTLVLPILISVGIPRKMAATVFLMAVGTGSLMNLSLWEMNRAILGLGIEEVRPFAIKLFIVNTVVAAAFILFHAKRNLLFATCAVAAEPEPETAAEPETAKPAVPAYALATPILPLLLHLAFGWPVIPAFIGGILFGVFTTLPRKGIRILTQAALKGMEIGAPAIILMIGIGMLLMMSTRPEVQAVLEPVLSTLRGISPWTFVIGFGLLSPLVLFRGPLNPAGLGIGIFALLLSLEIFPPLIVMGLLFSLAQVQNVCDPTNTHNVWVGSYTETPVMAITRTTIPFQMIVAFAGLTLSVLLFW